MVSRGWQARRGRAKEDMAQNFQEDLTRANISQDEAETLRWLVPSGVKPLPDMPTGTGRTKNVVEMVGNFEKSAVSWKLLSNIVFNASEGSVATIYIQVSSGVKFLQDIAYQRYLKSVDFPFRHTSRTSKRGTKVWLFKVVNRLSRDYDVFKCDRQPRMC